MMQLQVNATEIKTVYEQLLFSGKNFHVFIYNKTESVTGLHQHDYYEFTLVLTGRYYQEINGKRVLLERGDFVFIPVGSNHQSFYEFGATRILNVGISKRFFEQHYLPLLPFCFVASQVYRANSAFLTYIETVIASLNFRGNGLDEFIEVVTFYIINRLRHYREEQVYDDIPQWLKATVEIMHDKTQFGENALENMVRLSAKSQEYLTRATRRYYSKTPMQIINEIRINFAKKQLEMTNYSVTDIAYEAGYSSPSLFIKTFKKMTSFTPNSYRKRLTEIN
ncbi:transcriptional regulator ChbR [Salmonella enterica]|uniref:Transcriptional regulator ChbR n=1 Tax=Salmonella enterica subsp. VII serovar 40:z4,z24:[z39] TaxID=1967625 RepID=A0A731TEZ4_SALEE|nr:transcriptional regulator ChbR [Salmonella enterica]EDO5296590.1 transcriptional regulator ChbR [Salmonella enterica subsp. houtenae serovar 40:z4,z24:-]EDS6441412.1 transcriptional regulator ChbR [Salmonella enterica subsp. VII str. CFSAN000550]EDT6885845.1 transcriptional regulator ChbR [Salmonella enterica subsp. enterica]EDU7900789.1 transcriptional regulator ChbR [Salmonella enterica subsp. houtenae]QJY65959.1 transcriptional regulator ChbR [Salmonella enterica subsp. VII serovar 1,40: